MHIFTQYILCIFSIYTIDIIWYNGDNGKGAFFCERPPLKQKEGDNMTVSKAQQKAVNKYIAEKLDRVNLTMPKGKKEEIKVRADSMGLSVNAFINLAIDTMMAQGAKDTEE